MECYETLQRQIALCKSHEANGLAEYIKREYRGIRRNLELTLDETKAEARESYQETAWN